MSLKICKRETIPMPVFSKNQVNMFLSITVLLCNCVMLCWSGSSEKQSLTPQNSKKLLFWQVATRKGANILNRKNDRELVIKAAKEYGIGFIRLAPDKFDSTQRDFLIGSVDNYKGLIPEDLQVLKSLLDSFHDEQIPIVFAMLGVPGSRWRQNNNFVDDLRLWTDQTFQEQAAQFWQDLAKELKDHPAIVGYNILNEPCPERLYNTADSSVHHVEQDKVQQVLFDFYSKVVASIRQVDPDTPIVLESSGYSDPNTFWGFRPVNDSKVIYSFHMFEPYAYTNLQLNQGHFAYPGRIESEYWNKDKLRSYIEPVKVFQERYDIPDFRILIGEFGGHRSSKGLEQYFRDLISIFNENNWHFAVYAFREDVWDGMDYELGSRILSKEEWAAIEQGRVKKQYFPDNPVFKVLREEWSSQVTSKGNSCDYFFQNIFLNS